MDDFKNLEYTKLNPVNHRVRKSLPFQWSFNQTISNGCRVVDSNILQYLLAFPFNKGNSDLGLNTFSR